jgi:hypothetical protein
MLAAHDLFRTAWPAAALDYLVTQSGKERCQLQGIRSVMPALARQRPACCRANATHSAFCLYYDET